MATSDSQTSAPNKGFDLLRRRVRGHQGMIIGSAIVVSVLVIALLAPLLAPHDPYQQDLLKRLVPPVWDSRGSWEHVLGTDHLGRDYLSRLIYGARISLLIGIGAALISGIIGTIMGVMAGYFGGRVDMIVTFMITVRPVDASGACRAGGGSDCRWVTSGGDRGSWPFAVGQVRSGDAFINSANPLNGLCCRSTRCWLFDFPCADDRGDAECCQQSDRHYDD